MQSRQEIMAVGFFMLNFIYIKFLIIWRTAAASSMLDLVLPTDNMNRCPPLALTRACLLLASPAAHARLERRCAKLVSQGARDGMRAR